ncbi:LysR family transcriptional regulator [bacterium]|nr:LysR family transcriptional regulator [bacterium]
MNYTLNQLQIFLKISQTGSITKAAEELHLTQPAVSIQLKNFQDQFDIALTEVVGRKLYITDFGKEIAATAENILQQVHEINNKTLAYKGQLFGRLKISVVSTGKYVLPYFLSEFLEQHAGVELIMDVTNKQKVVESLEKNEVDFALVSILPDKMNVEKIDLLSNKLYLVGKTGSPLSQAQKGEVLPPHLPFIYREQGSGTRQTMEDFMASSHLSASKKLELTSNEAVKQAILAGLGYSIMPLIGIRNELSNNQLNIIEAEGLPIATMWSLIWPKGKRHSPVARAFKSYVDEHKSAIVSRLFSWYEDY